MSLKVAQTILLIAAIANSLVSGSAIAQTDSTVASGSTTEAEGSDDIVVVGDNGESFRLTGDALRDAARAFRQHRPSYAPDSQLYFVVEAGDGGTLDGLLIYLRGRDRDSAGDHPIVDLPIDSQGRFVLPLETVAQGRFDLRANRARGGIRLRPMVLSPGSSIADRRFGDMRLQCRVSIAFARLSLPVRMLAGAVGPCGSSRVALYTRAPHPLTAVTITGYDALIDIRPDGVSYRVPLQDQTIGNDARLRHVYR